MADGSRNNSLAMNVNKSIPDCLDPWLDTSSNCWPLDETTMLKFALFACPSRPMTLYPEAAYFHRPLESPDSPKTEATVLTVRRIHTPSNSVGTPSKTLAAF